ncbi:unnamed protein product, partial [Heterotrigona itama]
SIWTDFKPQIEGLDRGKFTIVAWDPPGYGRSRPPDRTFPDDFFQRDANWAYNLMKALGYTKFSLIGWSDGGITSLMLASMFPNNIRKMVAVAANAYVTPEEVKIYKNTWSEKMRAPMIEVYGTEYFRRTWSDWVDAVLRICEKQHGDLCKELLAKIKCPSLIIQGTKDAMILPEHPIYLKDHIVGAKFTAIVLHYAECMIQHRGHTWDNRHRNQVRERSYRIMWATKAFRRLAAIQYRCQEPPVRNIRNALRTKIDLPATTPQRTICQEF